MTFKTFSTLAGARRHRREIGGQIVRVLCDPDQIYIVAPSFMRTKIQSISDDGFVDGSIDLIDLTAGGKLSDKENG